MPTHQVQLSPYEIEVTEVTYQQFLAFMNILGPGSHRNGCGGQPCLQTFTESDTSNITLTTTYVVPSVISNHPANNVTWHGAQAYCQALGRRLPTEAEWEFAARGTDRRVYPWGNLWEATRANTNRRLDAQEGTEPVDAYPDGISPFGLFNMAGNVAEWVQDWYSPVYYNQQVSGGVAPVDPTGPAVGQEKVVRGGSWDAVPFFARTMHRQVHEPNDPEAWIGFRCAADPQAAQQPVQALPVVQPTIDLNAIGAGVPGGTDEETTANSQPTLPPPPTLAPTSTLSQPLATLEPGG
ncbi:MAG: formylglycine-generating enzyme family protein [Chloroflexi bacterium]|nr:formylglycine-generating enzyme family protein [Chloroflexota bacterium]